MKQKEDIKLNLIGFAIKTDQNNLEITTITIRQII